MALSAPSDLELLHGVDVEPPLGIEVHAGPVQALLIDGDLRYVRVDGVEVVRRVYAAIRDPVWDTVPGERTPAVIEQGPDGFRVTFESVHRADAIAFRWRCEIVGTPDGTISYEMDGTAERDSSYQRIGICVLHPTDVFAGAPFEAATPAGPLHGTLAAAVGPQRFEDGVYPPLVPGFERIRMVSPNGTAAAFAFEGDLFEIEDQRNWTDASFKSYSRSPPTRAEPWPLAAGTAIRQRLVLTVERVAPGARASAPSDGGQRHVEVTLEAADAGRVPDIGLAFAAEPDAHSAEAVARLRALGLAHLRVDLHLEAGGWRDALEHGAALAAELGCGLEVAAFFAAAERSVAAELAGALASVPPRRLLVFEVGAADTPVELVRAVRAACRRELAGVPIGGGTDVYFAELNRVGPLPADFEIVAYPVTPQVHADDDLSLIETPLAQADTVLATRAAAPTAAIAVTPITLRPRYNPDAPDARAPAGRLPDNVDRRQMSLIAAAWMLASIGRLGAAGAASATYFETVGWRGVIESDGVPAGRPPFPSIPRMVFPVYDVLHALAPLAGRPLRAATSSAPLDVAAVRVAAPDGDLLMVANLRARPQRARIGPLGADVQIQRLTVAAVRERLCEPRDHGGALTGPDRSASGHVELALEPYEIATLRWNGS